VRRITLRLLRSRLIALWLEAPVDSGISHHGRSMENEREFCMQCLRRC
jgi:hypothetical protein